MAKRTSATTTRTAAAAQAALANLADGTTDNTIPAVLTAPMAVEDPTLRRIPFLQLTRSHLNPRRTFDDDAIRELAESIAVQGLLQNLVVRQDEDQQAIFWIVAGERRFRAIELLARENRYPADLAAGVPCKVIEANDAQHLALALLENLQRVDVNPMEEAAAFAQLQALDPKQWTTKALAMAIGKATGKDEDKAHDKSGVRFVQQRLALVDKLCPEAQDALRENKITFSQARVLTMASPQKQAEMVKKAGTYLTADAMRSEITCSMVPVTRAIFDVTDYAGAIAEHPDSGTRYFTSKDEFLAAQRAAVAREVAQLGQEWAWVEALETYYFNGYHFEPARSEDRSIAGVVVQLDPMDGKVTFHEGLVKKVAPADDPAEQARRKNLDAQREQRQKAAERLQADLQGHLSLDPLMAVRLLILEVASSWSQSAPAGIPRGLPKYLVNGGALSGLASMVDQANCHTNLHTMKEATGRDGAADAWGVLARLTEQQTINVLANLVAHDFGVATWDESQGDILHPVVVALARHYQIPIPPILQGEQADIEDAVSDRIATEEAPDSVAARVRKVLRAQLVMDPDDGAVPEDHEVFAGDLNMLPEDAADLGQRLADEFGLARPPFVIDPDGETNLPDIGFNTVGDLITFLEKRMAHLAAATE